MMVANGDTQTVHSVFMEVVAIDPSVKKLGNNAMLRYTELMLVSLVITATCVVLGVPQSHWSHRSDA
jgi:hypothetical protein